MRHGKARDLQLTASCPTRCSCRSSRSRSSSSTGRRARRCGSRSCCRTRSGSRPTSSGSRTTASLFAPARLLPHHAARRSSSPIAVDGAVAVDRAAARGAWPTSSIKGAGVYTTLLIWPYAVAPAVAGVLWVFMFQPVARRRGARPAQRSGVDWNPLLNGNHAMILVILAVDLEADLLQLPVLPRRPAGDPESVIEAAAIDGARPMRRFWTIIFPLLSPTTFFLLVVNIVYAFFDTFGIIDAMTGGGPAKATETLVYKVYSGRPPRRRPRRLGGAVGDPDDHRRSGSPRSSSATSSAR